MPFQAAVSEVCCWPSFALQHANVHLGTNLACVSLHRAGGAVGLSEILKEQQQQRYLLETLKEQQQQQLTEIL